MSILVEALKLAALLFLLAMPIRAAEPPIIDNQRQKQHWAFQPIVRPAIPTVKDKAWVNNPIDAFVLSKLEANGLSPAPPAEKAALLRRMYFDLIGLPPAPEEIEAFLALPHGEIRQPIARINELLKSPHYGERWGRHWLDRGPLCRQRGLRVGRLLRARLDLPRLCHPFAQRRQGV